MLEISDLNVAYGHRSVVHDLSCSFDYGSITVMLGHNGAGKTSVLRAVMGLADRASGRVELDGVSLLGNSPTSMVESGFAYVPQGKGVFHELSVEDNLRLVLDRERRSKRQDLSAELDNVMEMFPVVRSAWKRLAGTLSGGQQQQVAIARAVLTHPRVLLLDEPSVGLSPLLVDFTLNLIASLRSDERIIVLVEQNVHQALRIADAVHAMKAGRLTDADLAPSELSPARLTELF